MRRLNNSLIDVALAGRRAAPDATRHRFYPERALVSLAPEIAEGPRGGAGRGRANTCAHCGKPETQHAKRVGYFTVRLETER